jgi:tryptophanyl-tRNA synthetase
MGYYKPAQIHSKFFPGLTGMHGKMSSSEPSSSIFLTDSPEEVKRKVVKYAFSGGRDTVEEHRKKGGNPDIDVPYQWLTFFEEDDKKLRSVRDDYVHGKLLTGEIKQILIDKMNSFLFEHQKKREKSKDKIEKFMLRD